jgi:hypothetical protein
MAALINASPAIKASNMTLPLVSVLRESEIVAIRFHSISGHG